jgi:multiple sugar transport system permease protein
LKIPILDFSQSDPLVSPGHGSYSVSSGIVTALLLNQITGRVIGFLRTSLIIPTIMTPVVVGLIWRLMYNPDMGMLNYFLSLFGFSPINWTGMPGTALPSVIMADIGNGHPLWH